MTTELVTTQSNGPAALSLSDEQLALLKRTIAKDSTDDELALFVNVCKRKNLDPFSKQIHFIKRAGKVTFQTAIDGYRAMAARSQTYAGSDDYRFDEGLTEYQMLEAKRLRPRTATVTVYKVVAGVRCPFVATARWSEYFPGEAIGFMWKKMPFLMLGKCAEALALRKAFPEELGGVYTDTEMMQAGHEPIVITEDVAGQPQKPESIPAIGAYPKDTQYPPEPVKSPIDGSTEGEPDTELNAEMEKAGKSVDNKQYFKDNSKFLTESSEYQTVLGETSFRKVLDSQGFTTRKDIKEKDKQVAVLSALKYAANLYDNDFAQQLQAEAGKPDSGELFPAFCVDFVKNHKLKVPKGKKGRDAIRTFAQRKKFWDEWGNVTGGFQKTETVQKEIL